MTEPRPRPTELPGGVEFREIGWPFIGYGIASDGTVWSRRHRGGPPITSLADLDDEWHALSTRSRLSKKYPVISLPSVEDTKDKRTLLVSTLVLEAFVGPRPEDRCATYADGDTTNCALSNLSWGPWRGGQPKALLPEQREAIRRSPMKQKTLAELYGVSETTVWRIKHGA